MTRENPGRQVVRRGGRKLLVYQTPEIPVRLQGKRGGKDGETAPSPHSMFF